EPSPMAAEGQICWPVAEQAVNPQPPQWVACQVTSTLNLQHRGPATVVIPGTPASSGLPRPALAPAPAPEGTLRRPVGRKCWAAVQALQQGLPGGACVPASACSPKVGPLRVPCVGGVGASTGAAPGQC
ncbi:hypothetical protein H1C71_011775, partial [Ictidomys tridecemlineatus]